MRNEHHPIAKKNGYEGERDQTNTLGCDGIEGTREMLVVLGCGYVGT
jgi:hypothetical protein